MRCSRGQKQVLLGLGFLAICLWISGLAIDKKLEQPAAQGCVFSSLALLLVAGIYSGFLLYQNIRPALLNQHLLWDDATGSAEMMVNPLGPANPRRVGLSPVLE